MKRILISLIAILWSVSAFATGTTFYNLPIKTPTSGFYLSCDANTNTIGDTGKCLATDVLGLLTLSSDNSTASHLMYKSVGSTIENVVTNIDAHADSTTITLIPGICPIIHNAGQSANDRGSSLPALAEGLCFTARVRTTRTNYWRLTAATAGTVCLDGTCGKNYVSFNNGQLAVDNYYKCEVGATDTTLHWSCYTGRGTPVTN